MLRSSLTAFCCTLAALPVALVAQEASAAPRTHTVRAGETLCQIARTELGDCKRWPEIQQANADRIRDGNRIYPGLVLRIPGAAGATTRIPVQKDAAPAAAPAAGQRTTLPEQARVQAAVTPVTGTVFTQAAVAAPAEARDAEAQRSPRSTVRAGEFFAAPIPAANVYPANAGRIVASGEISGIPASREGHLLQITERAFVTPPSGMTAAPGARMISFRYGPLLENGARVLIPTGILRIERTAPGEAATARVLTKFGPIVVGEGLLPLDPPPPADLPRPAAVSQGAEGTVLWVQSMPVLASLQSYVVIDRGERDGLRPGDQVMLYRPRERTADGVTLPEIRIATARIVRTGAWGSTAIIFEQDEPAIRAGANVRVTAKMP